jgi:hypothetical protein
VTTGRTKRQTSLNPALRTPEPEGLSRNL